MTTATDGPSWSDIAGWYDALVTAGSGPHETATACLLRLAPLLAGLDAVDEPRASGLLARQRPLYAEVPIFFAARARRVS
jgi:hypothetical protein